MSKISSGYITKTMERKVIYVYSKDYAEEKGFLKIGDTSIDKPNANLEDNSEYLQQIAEHRIRQYELTSPINILYCTLAVDNEWNGFRDHKVHEVLERSGISKTRRGNSTEWFEISLDVAIKAIDAVKRGESCLSGGTTAQSNLSSINFRPEQEEAIEKTREVFRQKKHMLWNAKMRFGKTLSALELIKREQFKKTIILTHRPIVDKGWYEDFHKIFNLDHTNTYQYCSRQNGGKIESLLKENNESSFIYFASMQDLRGSSVINGENGLNKNQDIFQVEWDFVIVDEAHEGTKTELAEAVLSELTKTNTKVLKLSGTPFNLLDEYEDSQIYTWDYVMEQEAKANWDKLHPGDSNPYSSLPKMQMFVYELGELIKNNAFIDIENKAFNFLEFFRVEDGKFVYEKEVWSFLNLISRSDDYATDKSNMPFSTIEYRNELRHTLWTMPRRESAVALEGLLKKHPVFSTYNIANLVDDGDSISDLEKIEKAITNTPEQTHSITLTVRKGTVGTTVKEWTGILVLNNTESASNYLQSIFRVQSPYIGKDGQKEKAYVFDFAPDRTLKMVAQAAKLNTKGGALNNLGQKEQMQKFLNFLPIIGVEGNRMKEYSVSSMLAQLKRAQAERAVRNGFDDISIYSDELLKLSEVDLKEFEKLYGIVGKTKQTKKLNQVDINNQGMSEEEWEAAAKGEKKKAHERTKEEQEALDKRKELSKQKQTMISILRGISIRIPLMIYGMELDIDDDITIDTFVDKVDDVSWREFMPNGITKAIFNKFKKYYDADIFIEAGRRIRRAALAADYLSFEERIDRITTIFSGFRNPDKETVLTPWRVVNIHLGQTIGGYNFFNESYTDQRNESQNIRFIDRGQITKSTFHNNTKVLEINSKTGLYPLYMAYSIYKQRFDVESPHWSRSEWVEKDKALWNDVLEKNIFVLNKTPMARVITYRTLNGYGKNPKFLENLVYVEDLTQKLREDVKATAEEILERFGGSDMKFDIVVGNPPYHENDNGVRDDGAGNASASPLYHYFFELAQQVSTDKINLIFPARWLTGAGKGMGNFSEKMLNDTHVQSVTVFQNSRLIFPDTEIKGGVLYLTYDKKYNGKANITIIDNQNQISTYQSYLNSANSGVFIPYGELISIYEKVAAKTNLLSNNIQNITSTLKPYGLRTDFFKNPAKYKLPKIFIEKNDPTDIEIIGLDNKRRVIRFVPRDYPIPTGNDTIDKWKVFGSYAYGKGEFGETTPELIVGKPSQICTETFLVFGPFDTEFEANAFKKYFNGKFFRALVGILKNTQHSTTTYGFVPLQNFTKDSDIDWRLSISEIDRQLYEKYELDQKEIDFIEDNVKPTL